jgi:hypothetical protein
MADYKPQEWIPFFTTTAGGAAALTGLVIVAVSVNIQPILKHRPLPARAAAAITTLVLILATSVAGLIPRQSDQAFGVEILSMGLVSWIIQTRSAYLTIKHIDKSRGPLWRSIVAVALGQGQVLAFLVAGPSLILGYGSGIYWIAVGVILAFILATITTWILLVEILR